MKLRLVLTFFLLAIKLNIFAQNVTSLDGIVMDKEGNPIESAHVRNMYNNTGVISDMHGAFSLKIPTNKKVFIQVSCIGYQPKSFDITSTIDSLHNFKIILTEAISNIDEVSIVGQLSPESNLIKLEAKHLALNPDLSGNLESLIKTMPGVSSNTELSSQYSVRGGNYDENLIYVNDIEIYKPMLVRSGQQEGLSFLNSDMVSSIQFSAGGFESIFGDKMSSVLDIRYNKPIEFSGSATMSLLGGALQFEDISENGKFTYNIGARYKTSKYILNTLETKGDYNPNFYDFQSYLSYKISNKLDFDFLAYYALNSYNFIPKDRETSFGTVKEALSLKIFYDGNEEDKFETYMGAFTTNYNPNENVSLKFILSSFRTIEQETYDIEGSYYLNELDNTIGSETYGDSIMNIGAGTFLNHARNYLTAHVYSASFKGGYYTSTNKLRWGVKYKYETIDDQMSQWKMIDSAGFSKPYNGETIELYESTHANNLIISNRINTIIQNTHNFILKNNSELFVNVGVRANYWDFNKEFFVTPRLLLSYKPDWQKDALEKAFDYCINSGFQVCGQKVLKS